MPQTNINTSDPTALRFLMNDVIFSIGDNAKPSNARQEEQSRLVGYGQNRRNYLFLIQEKKHRWMSAEAMEAFTKTLAALKLSVDDVTLLNLETSPGKPQMEDIIFSFLPKVMVLLGVTPQSVGLNHLPNEPLSDYNGITVFCTCTFDEMLIDGEKKKLFWST